MYLYILCFEIITGIFDELKLILNGFYEKLDIDPQRKFSKDCFYEKFVRDSLRKSSIVLSANFSRLLRS